MNEYSQHESRRLLKIDYGQCRSIHRLGEVDHG
jgi:hypothetical protein